jgi:hypothetical protein
LAKILKKAKMDQSANKETTLISYTNELQHRSMKDTDMVTIHSGYEELKDELVIHTT